MWRLELLRKSAVLIFLLLIAIWPAIYNGQPIFFFDTTAYIRGADAAISKLTSHSSVWQAAARLETAAPGEPGRAQSRDFVLAGRSVYYGALLYLGDALGHLWPCIIAQAGAALLAIGLTLHHFGLFSSRSMTVVTIGLAFVTPLAFFTSFLMPDLFAAVAILAATNLLIFGAQMTRMIWFVWLTLLAAAVTFHASHFLIVAVMLILAAPLYIARKRVAGAGIVALVLALALAVGAEAAFSYSVNRALGVTPVRPPFLMARLIADGPGVAFLRGNCPQADFAVCRFVDNLQLGDSDAFLWSTDVSHGGVFMIADTTTRRALADEEIRFALATLAFDPLGQITATIKNVVNQTRMIGLTEFSYATSGAADFYRDRVPSPYINVMERTKAWTGDLPTTSMSLIAVFATLASIFYLGIVLLVGRKEPKEGPQRTFVGTLLLGVVLNAFICGALSTPHDRYQARVIWLVPFAAFVLQYRREKLRQ